MALWKCVRCLVFLLFLWTFQRGDAEVCILKQSCILKCNFNPGDDVVIHWIMVAGNIPVHSYYHNQDQLTRQDQRFMSRTSLLKDQISKGNASLKLTTVEVQDGGRYKCYTSTITGNKETFIDLNVEAPVAEVDIQKVENRITCSSEGIYPKPELTWSTSPPSSVTFKNTTTVQETEQQLYNISGSLMVSDSGTDVAYSCTVSSGEHRRTATLFKQLNKTSTTETTIDCPSSKAPLTVLIWRFNHSQIIVTQTGANVPYKVSEEWRQQVKAVSESGNLALTGLTPDQQGAYTCEFSNEEETNVGSTFLRIEESKGSDINVGIVIVAIGIIAAAAGVAGFFYWKKRKHNSKQTGGNISDNKTGSKARDDEGSEMLM
ncbi:V-set domain-containing T-cell activation inhibitor 1-like [Dicentrarchus labrax]|uniref:V-set domain-containing T-cell activation inhibitor 1-like n=1 Tax=Dicentrarchus labrax TaxID=13489 RepID=UPI0021F5FBB6|nr:V-set domain-containing T-cell activation inhibitor 1-like [Dicentrarchus labrax]